MAVVSNGTTLIDAGALGASAGAGKLTLIKTLTASSSSTLSFVHGASSVVFDGTYDSYEFHLININIASNSSGEFGFKLSTDSGSNYNSGKTNSYLACNNAENGGYEALSYAGSFSTSNETGSTRISHNNGEDSDECFSGYLKFYKPADTTFVKHFISECGNPSFDGTPECQHMLTSGFATTSSAINAIQFLPDGGNFDGVIKLYGIGG